VAFKVIQPLQAYSNGTFYTVLQQLTTFTLHAEIYSARSYEDKIDRACIT